MDGKHGRWGRRCHRMRPVQGSISEMYVVLTDREAVIHNAVVVYADILKKLLSKLAEVCYTRIEQGRRFWP